jgi:DNA-binding XRE family transcriptional regulator
MLSFAETVRFHRIRLGMTQSEAAKDFGIALRTLQTWESGERKPNLITQRVVIACLESMRSEVLPGNASKRGYKSRKQEEVIFVPAAEKMAFV